MKTHPEWELTSMRTEYELKQEIAEEQTTKKAATITLHPANGKEEEAVIVIPDAWLEFHHTTGKKGSWHPVLLEIDRATEQQKVFQTADQSTSLVPDQWRI